MRRFIGIGFLSLLFAILGPAIAAAQVPFEYEDLVQRLVALEVTLVEWKGERDVRYREALAERASLEGALRSATEAHLAQAGRQPPGEVVSRLMTERDRGILGPRPWEERRKPPPLERAGDTPPAGPPAAAAQAAQEIADEQRERGLQIAEEARQQGRQVAEEARQRAAETAEEARERARDTADQARERARDLADEARERGRDAAEDARRGLPDHP